MTEEQKERKRIAQRKWYHKHLERERARQREWHRKHYKPHPRMKKALSDSQLADRAAMRASRYSTEKKKSYNREYYRAHKDYYSKKRMEYRLRERLLMATSPEIYAIKRAKDRLKHIRIRNKTRKREYRPLLSRRIPDYALFCKDCIDARSVFLRKNADADKIRSMDDFAIKLFAERKERMRMA